MKLRKNGRRIGALLSIELLFVLPIALLLLFAAIQFGTMMTGKQRLQAASREAARVASLGGDQEAIKRAAHISLGPRLAQCARIRTNACDNLGNPVLPSGADVTVVVQVPTVAVTPNLLQFVGLSLGDRCLEAVTIMRKE